MRSLLQKARPVAVAVARPPASSCKLSHAGRGAQHGRWIGAVVQVLLDLHQDLVLVLRPLLDDLPELGLGIIVQAVPQGSRLAPAGLRPSRDKGEGPKVPFSKS